MFPYCTGFQSLAKTETIWYSTNTVNTNTNTQDLAGFQAEESFRKWRYTVSHMLNLEYSSHVPWWGVVWERMMVPRQWHRLFLLPRKVLGTWRTASKRPRPHQNKKPPPFPQKFFAFFNLPTFLTSTNLFATKLPHLPKCLANSKAPKLRRRKSRE